MRRGSSGSGWSEFSTVTGRAAMARTSAAIPLAPNWRPIRTRPPCPWAMAGSHHHRWKRPGARRRQIDVRRHVGRRQAFENLLLDAKAVAFQPDRRGSVFWRCSAPAPPTGGSPGRSGAGSTVPGHRCRRGRRRRKRPSAGSRRMDTNRVNAFWKTWSFGSELLPGSRRRSLFCKKQFAMKMFSGILVALWYSTNRARLWIQPHKAF